MGNTQGLLITLVADREPAELRETAFGMFNLMIDLAALFASITTGALWDIDGYRVTFLTGAGFATLAAIGLFYIRAHLRPSIVCNSNRYVSSFFPRFPAFPN